MNRGLKLVLYLVCGIAVIVLGRLTVRGFRQVTGASDRRVERLARAGATENTNASETTNAAIDTNAAVAVVDTNAAVTNLAATNVAGAKNDGEITEANEI